MEEKQTTGAMPASDMSGTSPTVSPMPNAVSSTVPASSPVSSQPGFAQPVADMVNTPVTSPKKNGFLSLKPLLFTGIVVAGMGLAGVFAFMRPAPTSNDALYQQASSFAIQDVDLSDLATSGSLDLVTNQSLSVNGQLRTNNSLVITPTDEPLTGTAGQLYFDKSAAKFGYYDGSEFNLLAGSNELDGLRSQLQSIDTRVTAIPPVQSIPTDIATLGASNVFSGPNTFSAGLSASSLAVTGNSLLQGSLDVSGSTTLGATTISNLLLTSSLSVSSGGTGTNSLSANGVVIANGTDPLTTATYASGGQCLMSPASGSGAPVFGICPGGVGYGVNSLNGLMGDLVIANATASGATVTINDASGVSKGIASFNASNLTVTSGVVNTVQNISSTATPTFAGLTLTTDLSVANGGTGASSFTTNGIIIGNGTSALGTITPGSVGQCLIATAGAPTFQTCPSTPIPPNVSSLNGLTGALVLNNSVGSGSSITINDASTASKGIASFNSTNFSVSGGAVNTIQSINTSATPTFAGINTGSLASTSALSVSAAVNTNLTLATSGTGALYLSGYDCSASGNGGKLTVDATGRVSCGADGDTDTVGITEIIAGPGIAVSGNQVSVQLQSGYGLAFDAVSPNGLGIQACANTEILKSNGSGWVCSADNNTPGDGTGITAIGALDSGTLSADGASIGGAGTTLYLQSASDINPGLINTTTQTFGGAKTFNASALFAAGLTVSSGQDIILGTTCVTGEVLTTNVSGVVTCVVDNQGTDTNTTYTAGNGLTLSVANEFSANIRTNYGLQADGNGIALTDTCATGEILKRTAGGWACAVDSEGVDTNTTYTAGDGLTLTGTIFSTNIRSGFGLQADSNGLAMLESCATSEILKRTAGGWACASDAVGTGDGVGVTTVGTIDSQTKSADGAVIIGSTIYLQNADATSAGLVSAGAQTFGGAKTFNAAALFNTGLSIAAGQALTLGGACSAGQVLSTNVGGTVTCVTDTDTTYNAGTGLNLTGTQFSTRIRTGFGIQADGNGIALLDTCATGELLKRTAGGWACAVDGGDGVGVTVSGTYTDGSLTKFNSVGQIMNSNLSESGTTLTYSGNAVINAGLGFVGNLLDVQLNGSSRFRVTEAGVASFAGIIGAYGGIDTNNNNITTGNGTISGAINSTSAILLNGNDINAAGTLSNVAYLNQANTFSAANTFSGNATVSGANFSVLNSASANILQANSSANTLTVGTASSGVDNFTMLANPAALPTGVGINTIFSPDGQYLSVAHDVSPFITIYKRSGDTFTKLTNPAALPAGKGTGVAFSPDGQYMSVTHEVSPFITIYKRSGDTFTKLPDPATLPTGTGADTAFSPDGQYLSVAHLNSPFITIYKRSGDTFTKLTNPTTLPASTGNDTAFSPDGQYMSVAHSTSPFITIYKRSGDTFTKLTNPTTLPTGTGLNVAFSPDGQYLSVAHQTSPYITIYKRSGDTFTKLPDPASLPAAGGVDSSFSPDGKYLSVTHGTSPFVTIYKRSGDTFTKLPDPASLPAGGVGAAYGPSFSPDSQYMSVGSQNSPYISIYKIGDGEAVTTNIYGLLNGSAATFSGLSVLGASALQGSLSVTGLATFNDAVSIGGILTANTIQSAPATAINITGNNSSTISTTSGSLTLQSGTGTILLGTTTAISSNTSLAITSGTQLILQSTTSNAVTLDSGTTGNVNVGTNGNAKTITIGNTTGATALLLRSGTGNISLTGATTVTGAATVTANLIANSGLYTGAGAGTLRVSSTGALSNVSLGTSAGVVVAAPTTGALSVATTASSNLCLLSNGSGAAPSFQACPSGGGGWGLSGTAGTTVGTNYVGTSDNQALLIQANGGAPTPSYIQINSSSNDSIGAITIAGNGPAGSSGGGTNWFDVKQAGGNSFFGISGSGVNARVQMWLQPGANIGASTRVCTSNAANTAGFGYMGACGSPADLAENYRSTQTLAPGELVMADTISHLNVLKAEDSLNGRLMGIVSTKPHEVMGQDEVPNGYPIALSGRVPTKVNGEGGPIAVGDMITISSVPGVGKKATSAGMVVGTALNTFDGNGQGVIEVFVHLDYYEPSTLELLQANEARFGTLNVSGAATVDSLVVRDATVTGTLTVKGLVTVQSINVKGHIITSSGQPTAQTMNANLGGVVEVDGTDTTGTITITTGATVSAGELAKIIFSELYGKAPRVLLTPSNDAAGGLDYFKGITTTESFILNGKSLPSPNTTYKFDYFIAE